MTMLKTLRTLALAVLAAFLTAAGCEEDVGDGDSPGIYTVRVSINALEEEVAGPSIGSQSCSVSSDGRYVAFQSDSPDLVPGDSNGFTDIFVKDRENGSVELVSIDTGFNVQATAHCSDPSISADGRYVAFACLNSLDGLGLSDNGEPQIYVHDRLSTPRRTMRVLDRAINPSSLMLRPRISGDGQFVAFLSPATNLGGVGTNPSGTFQIWRSQWDLATPAIQLVSVQEAAPTVGTVGQCEHPSISFDGQKVAFMSTGSDVSTQDMNGINNVYVADPPGTAAQLVSRLSGAAGAAGTGGSDSSFISSDGNHVAFLTSAPNISAVAASVAIRQIVAPFDTTVVSIDRSGSLIPSCISPCLNRDATMVAFGARATPPDPAGFQQIWVRAVPGGIQYASLHLSGAFADKQCDLPSISADGRWVGFSTASTNLILRDSNGQQDVFMRGPLR